jgi:hypothetical protein
MAALILPLISNKNGAVYDSTVGVLGARLQAEFELGPDLSKAAGE